MSKGWIGVDLDGTLAEYNGWKGFDHIGEPIPMMVNRVRTWLQNGEDVRIYTARVSPQSSIAEFGTATPDDLEKIMAPIRQWSLKHLGKVLPVTCAKDIFMVECWDDRCVQVEPNTGLRVDSKEGTVEGTPSEKTAIEKQIGLNTMMVMMRNDLLVHVESLLKNESPIILQNNRTKGYNQGIIDSIGAISMYYQGLFGEATKNMNSIQAEEKQNANKLS